MIRSLVLRFGAAIALAAGATAAGAHDFFLLPERFTAAAAEDLDVSATVSASFPQLENVVTEDRIDRLLVEGPGEPRLVITGPGSESLALRLVTAEPGLVVAGVQTKARDVDYAEDRIGVILEEYRIGPTATAAVRALPGPRVLQVSSRRFAKTIVCASSCADQSAAARPLGADLEFVGTGSGTDHFLLVRSGEPLANHPVDLVTSDGNRQHLTTGEAGEVHLPDSARGTLMLFAAVMDPPAQSQRFTLNLSSLTFAR